MLVLHPSTLTEMDGAPGGTVCVMVAVMDGVSEGSAVGAFVFDGKGVTLAVAVIAGTAGVDEALVTPITTGVAVKAEGVCVHGRNGVGGL